jgi:hypothetical protein
VNRFAAPTCTSTEVQTVTATDAARQDIDYRKDQHEHGQGKRDGYINDIRAKKKKGKSDNKKRVTES